MKLVKTNVKKGKTSVTGQSDTSGKGENSVSGKQESGPAAVIGASGHGQIPGVETNTVKDSK
jgi:hypothetical protein